MQQRILNELQYQSSLELNDDTFEQIRSVPLASEVIQHARSELVKRLDDYEARDSKLFNKIINILQTDFVHIIRRQALSGAAVIRSSDAVFDEQHAIDITLDILAERGYIVILDVQKRNQAVKLDLQTGQIIYKEYRVFEFQIHFAKPSIRRG